MIHELAILSRPGRHPVGASFTRRRTVSRGQHAEAFKRRDRSPRHSRHDDSVLSAVDSTRGSRQHACRTIASTARSDRTHRGPDAAAPAALAERNPRRQRRPAAGLTPPASAVGSNVCRSAPQQRRRVRASVASFALVPLGRPAWARCPPIQIPIARMAAAEDWLELFSGIEPTSIIYLEQKRICETEGERRIDDAPRVDSNRWSRRCHRRCRRGGQVASRRTRDRGLTAGTIGDADRPAQVFWLPSLQHRLQERKRCASGELQVLGQPIVQRQASEGP